MRDGLYVEAIAHFQTLDTVTSSLEQQALWSF